MKARLRDLSFGVDGKQILSLTIEGDFREKWDDLKEKDLEVDIKKYRKKRSKNANDFLWTICEEIAKNQGITKEEVYRKQIREVGVYEPLPIREDKIPLFEEAWRKNGIGWFVDVVDNSFPGYKKVFAYYGTSTYNTEEMSRVINAALEDARALGIDLISPEELSLLLENNEKHHTKRS